MPCGAEGTLGDKERGGVGKRVRAIERGPSPCKGGFPDTGEAPASARPHRLAQRHDGGGDQRDASLSLARLLQPSSPRRGRRRRVSGRRRGGEGGGAARQRLTRPVLVTAPPAPPPPARVARQASHLRHAEGDFRVRRAVGERAAREQQRRSVFAGEPHRANARRSCGHPPGGEQPAAQQHGDAWGGEAATLRRALSERLSVRAAAVTHERASSWAGARMPPAARVAEACRVNEVPALVVVVLLLK